jgi:glycosyltransferase involved in cell wall biosynthesis
MKFSIVIVTYNRKKDLEKCLASIKRQTCAYPYEVIVIFNGELSYLEKTKSSNPTAKIFYTPSVLPSAARNFGITKCQGEYILFLDDDCALSADYFKNLNFEGDWDVLGGPDQTPPEANDFQKTFGQVLASPFCMGKTYRRHSISSKSGIQNSNESNLILGNLWFKTKIFTVDGHRFDSEYFRNEENFLLKKLKLEGKVFKYDPSLYVYHYRSNHLGYLANTLMKRGESRVLNFMKLPVISEVAYFLPLIFNLVLFTWMFNLSSKLGFIFLVYALIVMTLGIAKYKNAKPSFLFMHLFILFMYSVGLLKGLFQHTWILGRREVRSETTN